MDKPHIYWRVDFTDRDGVWRKGATVNHTLQAARRLKKGYRPEEVMIVKVTVKGKRRST